MIFDGKVNLQVGSSGLDFKGFPISIPLMLILIVVISLIFILTNVIQQFLFVDEDRVIVDVPLVVVLVPPGRVS